MKKEIRALLNVVTQARAVTLTQDELSMCVVRMRYPLNRFFRTVTQVSQIANTRRIRR